MDCELSITRDLLYLVAKRVVTPQYFLATRKEMFAITNNTGLPRCFNDMMIASNHAHGANEVPLLVPLLDITMITPLAVVCEQFSKSIAVMVAETYTKRLSPWRIHLTMTIDEKDDYVRAYVMFLSELEKSEKMFNDMGVF